MADTYGQNAGDAARQEASKVGEEIRQKGAEAAQAAKDTAKQYAERARDEAYARGEAYRDYAADETGKVASALRKASEDLSAGSPQERFVAQIADSIADTADRMRGMNLNEAARETTDFARRHPAAFLGGAALIGFAAARFLKASASHEDDPLYLSGPAPRSTNVGAPSTNMAAPSSEPIPAPATTAPRPAPTPAQPGPAASTTGTGSGPARNL